MSQQLERRLDDEVGKFGGWGEIRVTCDEGAWRTGIEVIVQDNALAGNTLLKGDRCLVPGSLANLRGHRLCSTRSAIDGYDYGYRMSGRPIEPRREKQR
ncbi:MAG: hypothetical protein R3B96_17060 [Pirellulaceae bacterium]